MKKMLVVLYLLNGCVHYAQPVVKIPPPADLTTSCKKLPVFNGKDMQDIVKYSYNLINLYKLCQIKHDALIAVVK